MKKQTVFFSLFCFIFSLFLTPLFAETAEPYKDEEFPGFMHDLRRAEIITLGAMPFTTFNVSLGYSFGKFAAHNFDSNYFVNPFSTDSDSSYSTDEQVGIILSSLGISFGIGLTDFIVHSIKRSNQQRRKKLQTDSPVTITPIQKDPEAVLIEINNSENETTEIEADETE